MKNRLHKLLALLAAVALLCTVVPLGATATETTPADLMSLVGTSRSEAYNKVEDNSQVLALAFRFRMSTAGLSIGAGRKAIYDNAKVTFGGTTYAMTGMGAVMCNKAATGNNPNVFKIGATGVTHIPANYLLSAGKNYGEFIARIVNIPENRADTLIYARPYFTYKDANGDEFIVYGNIDCANASGKKIRYSIGVDALDWTLGTLDATGSEQPSTNEIRTDYINSTDLLIRLPEDDKGTPTAYVRAYYYSEEAFLTAVDIDANWTVLKDLGVPEDAVSVRLVAYHSDNQEVTDVAALGNSIQVDADKKQGALPLPFQFGTLSDEDGSEIADNNYTRTGYIPVQDLLVKPDGGSKFVPYYYDGEKNFLVAGDFFMAKAKRLLDIAPEDAVYVRFVLEREEILEDGEEGEEFDEPLPISDLPEEANQIPECVSYFRAYVSGSAPYGDFSPEADELETKPTESTTTTESATTTESTTETTETTSGTGSADTTTTSTTVSSTTTTKRTTSTTRKTTTTKNPGSQGGDLILTSDKPENQGVQNALWNMEQMVKITYTPIKPIPQNLSTWPANVQQMGLPYSSTRIEQAYVPQNVSFHTFMTSLKNPNSYMYTVDLNEDYGNINGKTYYGAVCSTACGYALGIVENYTSYQWSIIPGMELVPGQDLQNLKLCDTIAGQGHVAMVTGISRDQHGNIVKVYISEAAGSDVHMSAYTITAMENRFPADLYEYCRYTKLSKVTYTASEYVAVGKEKAQTVSYNTNIIPRKGDKANWRTNETVILDVVKKSTYTGVEIHRWENDGWVKEETRDIASVIRLKGQDPGTYRARLISSSKTSKWCYWKVVDAVSVGEHYQTKRQVKVSFSASNAEPLYVQWMNGHTNATVRITLLTQEQIKAGYGIFVPATGELKVRVAFKTAYGIIYSELPDIITVEKN